MGRSLGSRGAAATDRRWAAARWRRVRACARASGLLPGLSGPEDRPLRTGDQDARSVARDRVTGRGGSVAWSPVRWPAMAPARSPAAWPGARRGTPRRAARGWPRRSGRRGARRSRLAIARPSPVPPAGAPGARQNRSNICGMSSGRMPGPRRRPRSGDACRSAATRTVTEPPRGLWRIALSTRIVTSWRSRAGSPTSIAGSGSSLRRRRSRACGELRPAPTGAVEPRRRRGRPASGSARRPRSRTGRGAAGRRPARSAVRPRRRCRRAPRATRRPASSAVTASARRDAADHRERRPELVARVGRELALAAEGRPLGADDRGSARAPARA